MAGPAGVVIDYREKLPGRGVYVCPNVACIQKAFGRENISRALQLKVKPIGADEFISLLVAKMMEKVKSLVAMAAKAGMLSAGYSAVHDALEKGRLVMLLYARDISADTKDKVVPRGTVAPREATLFTRDELGGILNRELVGVIGIHDKGLADAVWRETERLKRLIINNE